MEQEVNMNRFIDKDDRKLLEESIGRDSYHKDTTTADFFYSPTAICTVQEDDNGPVFFLRATKALRLDIQFVDNLDKERNAAAMLERLESVVEQAKQAGFTELVFCSDSPGLMAFCKRKMKFKKVNGEMRKFI